MYIRRSIANSIQIMRMEVGTISVTVLLKFKNRKNSMEQRERIMFDLIYAYENYLKKVKQASYNTVSSYLRDIRQFGDWLQQERHKEMLSAVQADISDYLEYLQLEGKSSATISRTLASLKNFFSYLVQSQVLSGTPVSDEIRIERGEKKFPNILTGKEVELLLSQPACLDAKGYRDKAMLEVMYATGMRVSELINLNLEDVNIELGTVCCRTSKKPRMIPLYPTAVHSLSLYIQEHRATLLSDPTEPALFVNVSGSRMSRQGFWKILKYYQTKAGIEKEITPHTLRHSFAVHLLENGTDLTALQELMGHSDISSTQMYVQLVNQKIKSMYQTCHPKG